MNNINTQVSSRNGVDFSKIRKAQEGLKIPKFLTGGIGNRKNTYIPQSDWWNAQNQSNIALWLKIASEHPEMTLEELNNFIAQNHNLYINTKYNGSKAIKGEGVNQYQRDYHNKYGFGNSDSFWNGWTNAYNGKSLNTGDSRAAEGREFTGDNYFGEQTNRRLANYFNESELAQANDAVKSRGWHWELADYNDQDNRSGINGRRFYKLVDGPSTNTNIIPTIPHPEISSPRTPTSSGTHTLSGTTTSPGTTTTNTYNPIKFTPPFKFKPQPFTSPITNGVIAGLGLAANKHVYDNEMEKKVPLLEAPYHQYRIGSYKAIVDAYNKAGADIQSQANRIASQSSNLEQNQAIQLQGAEMAANKKLEGALKLQEGYNLDRKEAINTAYFNSDAANRIANINRLNLVADWNRRMDAKSKYLLQRNAIWADNIMKNRTDYGQWKANEENERDAALSAYNQHLANLDMQDAKKPYQNLLANPIQSNTFNQVYSNAWRDFNSRRETDPNWVTANRDLVDIFKTGTDVNKRNAFLTYLQTHGDSDYGKLFTQGYNSELTTLKNKYIQDAEDIQNDLSALAPSFRNTYTTEGWYNPKRLGKQYQRRFAEGGILKMKRGSRFVDYLEHNRKALRDQKLTTMENVKQAQKTLQHQLEAIDRETLILLRSIFK